MKKDLRIIRTEKSLEDALLGLLYEYPYSKITVNQIATAAMVNRNTFYLHYADKDSLLEAIIARHLMKVQKVLPANNVRFDVQTTVNELLNVVQQDMFFYKAMLTSGSFSDISVRLTQILQAHLENGLKHSHASYDTKSKSYTMLMQYTLSGIIGLISMWVEHDAEYTLQEVSNFLTVISQQKMSDLL